MLLAFALWACFYVWAWVKGMKSRVGMGVISIVALFPGFGPIVSLFFPKRKGDEIVDASAAARNYSILGITRWLWLIEGVALLIPAICLLVNNPETAVFPSLFLTLISICCFVWGIKLFAVRKQFQTNWTSVNK